MSALSLKLPSGKFLAFHELCFFYCFLGILVGEEDKAVDVHTLFEGEADAKKLFFQNADVSVYTFA